MADRRSTEHIPHSPLGGKKKKTWSAVHPLKRDYWSVPLLFEGASAAEGKVANNRGPQGEKSVCTKTVSARGRPIREVERGSTFKPEKKDALEWGGQKLRFRRVVDTRSTNIAKGR